MHFRFPAGIALATAIVGCAGMKMTTTTRTSVNGKTTVTSSDPEEQKRMDAQAQSRANYQKELEAAEKRKPQDPIVVAFFETSVGDKLKKAGGDQIHDMLLKELAKDPIIQIVDARKEKPQGLGSDLPDYIHAASSHGVSADVYVLPVAFTSEMVGISRSTKKLASAPSLVIEGRLSSGYAYREVRPKQEGHLLANVQVIKQAAAKIRAAILNDIGPTLPAREAVARIQQKYRDQATQELADRAGIRPEDDKQTRLRKLLFGAGAGAGAPDAGSSATK